MHLQSCFSFPNSATTLVSHTLLLELNACGGDKVADRRATMVNTVLQSHLLQVVLVGPHSYLSRVMAMGVVSLETFMLPGVPLGLCLGGLEV